ncbi:uncharacterized protein N7482_003777 [Penicillium canariense]|uniref:Serine aminopeptidase S33 domain-containing protein n=1 Tax=Penicillium canariense TaxID=189055 RepID=A0A9W9I7D6_9EURO|nr:uncharacterized protein N7482_003777 [Penicillium canariense]KAJ5168183.1 hypothetical protein N7482_003777 [Penicillium canariense]
MSVEEGTHVLPDGVELYTKTWKPDGPTRAVLAFVHGFSDHCNAYYDFFPNLATSGIEVRAFDQRGWGRTFKRPQDRGNTGGTPLVLSDIHSFLLSLSEQPNTPLFLMGHSMGGGEVLTYALHPESPYNSSGARPQLAGVLAYSPFIALHPDSRPASLTVVAGRLVSRILPRMQRHSPLDPTYVCRDETVVADYVQDELCHDIGTLEQLAGMLDRALWLEKLSGKDIGKTELLPMWFGHGDADRITSWDATKRLAGVLKAKGDVSFASYEGAYHRLHMEPGDVKPRFAKDMLDWMLARCPVPASTDGAREVSAHMSVEQKNEEEVGNKAKL